MEAWMTTLAETISSALRAVGPATEDRIRGVIQDFNGMHLSSEERLAAIATAIAATAYTHHGKHKGVYLDAVKTWALEIASEIQPAPIRLQRSPDMDRVEEAAEVLIAGIDVVIEMMTAQHTRTQDRLVAELALVSRLLGQKDVNTIHLTLLSISEAVTFEDFRPGDIVMVPVRENTKLVTRDASLADLSPRGCA
jgi:hypothetical protein